MNRNGVTTLVVVFVVFATAFVAPAFASVIPSRPDDDTAAARARTLEEARELLARDEVAMALAAHGLSAEEVNQRLDRLSDEDVRALASNLDQIQAAGEVPKYIWYLLAALIVVTIIVLIA